MSQTNSKNPRFARRRDASTSGTVAALLATVAIGATLSGGSAAQAAGIETQGWKPEALHQAMSRHTLHTLDGKSLTLQSLEGEVVVVNFWASWCKPCRRELPALDALNREIARQGARVVAVSIDEDAANARDFARAHKLTLPIVHDGPGGLASELDLQHVPFTLVLDRDGEVAYTVSGANDAAIGEIGAVTRRLIAKSPFVSRATPGGTP